MKTTSGSVLTFWFALTLGALSLGTLGCSGTPLNPTKPSDLATSPTVDLATTGYFADFATAPVDMAKPADLALTSCLQPTDKCPPNTVCIPGPYLCEPCGKDGLYCCEDLTSSKVCETGLNCQPCSSSSSGTTTRCQQSACGLKNNGCCWDFTPYTGAMCGVGPPHEICFGGLACVAHTCK